METKNQKGFAPLIILFLVVIAVFGYFGYRYYTTSWQLTNQHISSPTPSITIDPTINWKTYTNSQYNYSIKFPSDFKAKTGTKGGTNISDTKVPAGCNTITCHMGAYTIDIDITPTSSHKDLKTIVEDFNGQTNVTKPKSVVFNGYPALYYEITEKTTIHYYTFKPNPNIVIEISYDYMDGKKESADQILSTFKFTN